MLYKWSDTLHFPTTSAESALVIVSLSLELITLEQSLDMIAVFKAPEEPNASQAGHFLPDFVISANFSTRSAWIAWSSFCCKVSLTDLVAKFTAWTKKRLTKGMNLHGLRDMCMSIDFLFLLFTLLLINANYSSPTLLDKQWLDNLISFILIRFRTWQKKSLEVTFPLKCIWDLNPLPEV